MDCAASTVYTHRFAASHAHGLLFTAWNAGYEEGCVGGPGEGFVMLLPTHLLLAQREDSLVSMDCWV